MADTETLTSFVRSAADRIPYYQALFAERRVDAAAVRKPEDLARLPRMTKEGLQKGYSELLAWEYQKYPLISYVDIQRAFGRKGECLKVIWDVRDEQTARDRVWALRARWYGVQPQDRAVSFYRAQYAGNKIIEPYAETTDQTGAQLSFWLLGLSEEARLAACWEKVLAFRPVWMQLDADMALLLTEHIQRHGAALPESLRYLELVGPAPTAEIRDAVRRAFGRTAGYLYTSAETGPAALTCPEGRLHVLEDNVVAETVRDGAPALGEAGDVVLTTLGNRAMPLLRYETDDTGVLEPGGDCACGCRGPVLRLEPAGDTRILLPDGRRLHSAELLGAMEYANEYMACAVRQFSIEQTGPAQFHAVLSLKPANQGWGDAVVQAFRAHLRNEALRQADWTFSFVDGPIRQARQGAFVPLGAQAVGIA